MSLLHMPVGADLGARAGLEYRAGRRHWRFVSAVQELLPRLAHPAARLRRRPYTVGFGTLGRIRRGGLLPAADRAQGRHVLRGV